MVMLVDHLFDALHLVGEFLGPLLLHLRYGTVPLSVTTPALDPPSGRRPSPPGRPRA